jgi:cytochrome P450/NADPH-cytochrome P450 reductase
VDTVIGKEAINVGHMSKLPYIDACLRETLRLHSPAPIFSVHAVGKQVLDGRYEVEDGTHVNFSLHNMHRDPAVYGADAESFRPERMEGEAFEALPPNSWKV